MADLFTLVSKCSSYVADGQHAALDQHLATSLVQLPEACDACAQLRDIVDVYERAVVIVVALEHHRAAPADGHCRAIPELDGARDASVELGEVFRHPVMWLLAPESRYHFLCSVSALSFSPRSTCARLVDVELLPPRLGLHLLESADLRHEQRTPVVFFLLC
ncbi:hypothetical protein U9M48_019366 [Paspalum notatum var. saurae]|uniref:Uncharacterized protein n=1 Tax=Paspalum notatum var. saurae TaxID=547442 RepID=A0AAQ3WQP2_PASNO